MRKLPNARAVFTAALMILSGAMTELHAQTPTTLNYVDARLADVIRSLATALGVNVVLTNVPDKRITFSTPVPVRAEELPGVLESILESNKLILVQKGALATVMPADSAPPTGVIRFGKEIGSPPPVGLITQMVPLTSIRADEAAAALKQIAGPRAKIEAVVRSNSIMITDLGSNVARYLEFISQLDQRQQGEAGLRTYVVPLRYANADDLAASLGQLYGVTVGASQAPNLSDRSLSRSIDYYREREAGTFQLPRQAAAAPVLPGDSAQGRLIGTTTVVADQPTNSLMIRTAPPNFPLLQETIQSLDVKPPQVLFEVTVAEIQLGKTYEFGIDWSVFGSKTSVNRGTPLFDSINSTANNVTTDPDAFVVRVVSLDRVNVRAVLTALQATSQVKVLSTPEVLAVNNREARIVVGSRVPFVASTRVGDFTLDRSVQYQDVGTTLTVIPTINQDDYVSVQILQEVNSLTNQLIPAAQDAPVISTKEASTRAIMRDGQTVVIGGLIGETVEHLNGGIPFLMDIPLLGNLFKKKRENRTRSELAIFVTPFIVRSDQDADQIRERVRQRMGQDTVPPVRR